MIDACEFRVVPMEPRHLEQVLEIERLSFSDPWSINMFMNELNNSIARYIVVICGSARVVGFCGFWKICDEGHIMNIAVHPEYRRMGIGESLLENIINYARKHKIHRMTLEVRESNIAARNLYEKYGFKSVGIRKEYYQDNKENAIIMWRED